MRYFNIYHMAKCVCVFDVCNCTIQNRILMFLTLVSKANFYIFRINDWLRAIAVYLLIKTLILAIDHSLSLVVFLYRVKYLSPFLSKTNFVSNTSRFLLFLLEIDFVDNFSISIMIFRRSNRLQK